MTEKERLRLEIEQQTRSFLRSGGVITQHEPWENETTRLPISMRRKERIEYERRRLKIRKG